jgi:Na+-transporting methylmalonyl-CoA/oxaloacetate decarboxylase gamma subunit
VLKAAWFVLAGMAIVFATLALLVLVMTALNRWFRPTPEARAPRTRVGDV